MSESEKRKLLSEKSKAQVRLSYLEGTVMQVADKHLVNTLALIRLERGRIGNIDRQLASA